MLQHLTVLSRILCRSLALPLVAGVVGLLSAPAIAAPPAEDDPLAGNPRLERKITISAEGIPLGDLFKLVAAKTGVAVRADAQTADDKIVLFGPARPLQGVMRDIAMLFHDRWLHSNQEGKEYYTLIRTERSKEEDEALANAVGSRMMMQLDAQVRALSETPEQMAKRPQNDPIRLRLANPQIYRATELYAILSAEQRETLFQQTTLHLPFEALPAPQQEGIRKQYAQEIADAQRYNSSFGHFA